MDENSDTLDLERITDDEWGSLEWLPEDWDPTIGEQEWEEILLKLPQADTVSIQRMLHARAAKQAELSRERQELQARMGEVWME